MIALRPSQSSDLDALYAISLATGLAGGDAAHLYDDPRLMGHIYIGPYASLAPGLTLVVEDAAGVGGYVTGALDSDAWSARLEAEWWPQLRARYAEPAGAPESWTADQRRCAMIHHPEAPLAAVAADYPAHLHMNLLPRLQGQGLGSRLLAAWLALAAGQGARAVHIGVNHLNTGGLAFWGKRGFRRLSLKGQPTGRTIWMGRHLAHGDLDLAQRNGPLSR